jgi:hypothetical protein
MMNLQDVKDAIQALSNEEQRELLQYMMELTPIVAHTLSAEERITKLDKASQIIRTGLDDAQWQIAENAMNEEYVEQWDESEWHG